MRIYTIGHSTHRLDEFLGILATYDIKQVADVRSIPRSRHTPQFNKDSLAKELLKHDVKYRHIARLGGLRHAAKDSLNTGWHNLSFRGYADYMQTDDFQEGIDELIAFAKEGATAIMCAEAVPWRCHRSMIGDALIVRDIEVVDILNEKKTQVETITSFAQVKGHRITYPSDASHK